MGFQYNGPVIVDPSGKSEADIREEIIEGIEDAISPNTGWSVIDRNTSSSGNTLGRYTIIEAPNGDRLVFLIPSDSSSGAAPASQMLVDTAISRTRAHLVIARVPAAQSSGFGDTQIDFTVPESLPSDSLYFAVTKQPESRAVTSLGENPYNSTYRLDIGCDENGNIVVGTKVEAFSGCVYVSGDIIIPYNSADTNSMAAFVWDETPARYGANNSVAEIRTHTNERIRSSIDTTSNSILTRGGALSTSELPWSPIWVSTRSPIIDGTNLKGYLNTDIIRQTSTIATNLQLYDSGNFMHIYNGLLFPWDGSPAV